MKNIRKGNIELSSTAGYNIHDGTLAEVVCWQPNPHYGKEGKYHWTSDGEYAFEEDEHYRIHKSCFKNPEVCYVLAFIRDRDDEEPDIESVGSRPFHLSDEDHKNYMSVCRDFYEEWNLGIEQEE